MAQQDFSLLLNLAPDAAPVATDADSFVSTIGSALEKQESGGKQLRPDGTPVTSKKGAIGKWQVMPGTAPEAAKLAGVEFDDVKYRTDGEYNSLLGKAYLKKQFETYEDPAKALAAYNAGPGAVDSAIARAEKAGNPNAWLRYLPAETQQYVPSILGRARPQAQTTGSYSNARPLAAERSTGEAIADVALGAGAGVVQGVGMLAGAFGADNAVARGADTVAKTLTDSQSQYRKDQRTERSFAIKGAEGSGSTWNEIVANAGAFAEAPVETTLNALGTSAPTILMGVIPGLGQAGAARLIMQGAMGAAQGAGAAKGSIYEAVVQKLIEQGEDPEVAAKVAAGAQAYDSANGGNIAVSALLGVAAGTSGVESAVGRMAGKKAAQESSRGIAGRAVMGVVKEAPMEGTQGGQERVTSNVALQNEGFDVPTFQGVAGQAAGEALASAPGGAAFGAMDRGLPAAPKAPPALQPVIEKAAAGGVLSKAAVAGNAGVIAQAAAAPVVDASGVAPVAPTATPDNTQAGQPAANPLPTTDAMGERVRAIEAELRGSNLLDTLREDGLNAAQVFDDLSAARNLNAPMEVRQDALSAVEELLAWAKQNQKPRGPMDTIETPQPMQKTVATPVDQSVPSVDAVVTALRDEQISRLISDTDRQNLVGLIDAAKNPALPAETRRGAVAQAQEIVGRYQAPTGQANGQSTPALTTPAGSLAQASDNKASPDSQLMVAANTGTLRESEFLDDVDAPKVAIPAGKDPAFIRRRAAEIRQLVDNGFETVERAGSEFFLINSKTGQRFKLSGMADSQLARKAIADRVNALANTAAASPKNDRAEPTKAQIEAGNYKKSDVIELNGMKIKIENPKDSIRRGTSPDGEMWETKMAHHYGEFQGTLGADGDKLDVFVGPRPDSTKVYVIDQVNQDGSFDEHKVMMGFTSQEAARQGYLANYEKGWTGLGAITEMGVDEFKAWSKSRAAKKPAAAVAENAPAATEKSVAEEQKPVAAKEAPAKTPVEEMRAAVDEQISESTPAKFDTLGEAKAFISAQRRSGTSVSALPYPNEDGTFGIAIKGTPGYAKAEKEARKKPKKTKAAKSPKQGEMFTIKSDGVENTFYKVDKTDLPKGSSSVDRDTGMRALTQSDVELLQRLGDALGKKVQIFTGETRAMGSGFVRDDEPNTIYVNAVTTTNPLAVFGHELMHKIKDENPKAWESIAKVVEANIGKDAYQRMMGIGYTEEQSLEEIVSDLGGDLLTDASFWRDVFGQIEADHGKDAKGIIAKLVAYLNSMVEQLINDIKQPGYNAQSLVKDVRAVRAAYKEGITQYLKDANLTRPALQAQILREETALKKSLDRAQPKVGIHFSKEPRTNLIGSLFGTGLKGAERARLSEVDDMRIKRRISFYVDEGNGITPESGVGGVAHEIKLPKLYDARKNAEGLFKDNDLNGSESRVLDAGYDGYWVSGHSNKQGVGVILGDAARSVSAKQIKAPAASKSEPVETALKKSLMSDELSIIDVSKIPGASIRAGILTVPAGSRDAANDELARISAGIRFSKDRIDTAEEKAKREYAEVEAQYKGTDQWLKAPNGSETNLNERQWVQVRTPSFKAWFGDWEKAANGNGVFGDMNGEVSVAVDANGEPLVVYHGTNKGGFAEFKTPGGEARGDLGIFTTPNLAMAQTYYSKRGGEIFLGETDSLEGLLRIGFDIYDDVDFAELYEPDGTFVQRFDTKQQAEEFLVENYAGASPPSEAQSGYYAMFINMRNPNENDFEGAHWNGERPGQYIVTKLFEQQYDDDGRAYFDSEDEAQAFADKINGYVEEAPQGESTDSVVREARRYNNDGALIRNVVDSGPGYSSYIDEASDVFVALDPSQLKSASFNNGAYSVDSADIRKSRDRSIPASMDAITSADASFEFAKSKEFGTNRDFKLAMQARTQAAAKQAKVNLEDESAELTNYLVRIGVADAKSGLRDNANAVGWYDEKVKKALRLVGLIHPEINTDPEAKFAFIWALAVTSNGMKVNKNFELAEQVYEEYKRTGKMPTNIKAGTTQKAINKSLGMFNKLRDAWGMEQLMRFMTTKLPVRDIENSSKVTITGEGKDTEVYGAAVLGPKVGNGFFMNLYGRFDQLTMDRWLMRTWGRWIGKLVDVDMTKVRLKREQLSGLIRMLSPAQKAELQAVIGAKLTVGNIDETSQAIWKASQKISLREKMNAVGPLSEEQLVQLDELLGVAKANQVRESLGGELRKLGNALRGYLDGQIEAPGGSNQRNFIRSVFAGILGKMREENPDLSMADLQAVVWYPEKLLYDAAKADDESADEGYSDDEAPDYANAAALLAAEKGVSSAKIKEAINDVDYEIQAAKRARDAQRSAGGDERGAGRSAGVPEQAAAGADAGSVQEQGRVRRSRERLDGTRGSDQGSAGREEDGSLKGLPRDFTVNGKAIRAGHWAPAEKVAQEYMKAAGLEYNPPTEYVKVDKERATRIAAEYDRMKHDPQNPEVKAAYAAMIEEVSAQYQAIIDSGFNVEFIDYAKQGDPYAASPRLATEDARKNNHMWVFSTRDGFGSSDLDVNDNPMLTETKFEISGQKALANDLFRVVHDYFGHVKEGVGFRADGEENTWRSHSAMFTPLAQRALTTETRGQNSWVNFGPYGESNRTASGSGTHYADQKVGLLPLWVSEDGRGDDGGPDGGGKKQPEIKKSVDRFPDTPEFKRWFKDSQVVNAQGDPLVMYHGTAGDFDEFKSKRGELIYFTKSPETAQDFADGTAFDNDTDGGENILPVYLSAQNVFDPDNAEHIAKLPRPIVRKDLADGGMWDAVERHQRMIKNAGFDGVYVRETPGTDAADRDVAVFSSEQVKSATGNNGDFDSSNPNITKSADRKPWFDSVESIKLTSGYQLSDLLNSSGKLSWWDKSVGTMYNLAEKHPQFKRVFDAVQTFIDDVSVYANRAADFAPNILPKLETWRDIFKKPLSAEDVQALRDPIFQGTLSFSRDENGELQPEDDVSKAGVVFSEQELREYFQLNDRQIGLYREFRNAVDQSITDLALSDMLRYLGEDSDGVRDRVMGAKSLDQAEREIQAHLDMLIEQKPQRAEVLTNTKEVIEDKVEQANRLMERGYAPLSRYGKYTVYVVGKNGEQEYFSMFETDKEAQKMAREMREQYPDSEVTTGTMSQESYKLFSGVTPETLALFGESMGLEENGVDEKSQAYQQYLKLAKSNRSAMKRLIQRKGIDGFSEDAGRVLAGFVYSNARQVSTNLHAGEISKSVMDVKDGDVKDAAIKLMQYIQNPQEEAQALRGLMFAQFIGGSVASALVNMTQPFTMTMPYLSQFAGAVGAATRMTDALKLVSKGITGDDDLAKALKRAEDDGVVSPQEVHQLMAQSQGKGALQSGDGTKAGDAMAKANNSLAKLSLGWGKLFGAAEQFNRRVTFIAAYKLARDQKMPNPFEFAENAIRETQGVYNKGNKPQWARGAVGATLFTFKQYSIAYVEFLQRMWGNGPEGKKAVGMALLVLFLMSGLGGMPGADDLDDVIDGIAQRVFNKSFDSKQAKKEFFNKLLGETLGDLAMGGITSLPGSPIDLSGRLGLGNLIPGTGVFTKKTSYTRDAMEIAGPAGTMVSNWLTAGGQIAQGDVLKAAKTVAPVAAQNLVKAADMFTMGQYRDEKGRKVIDVDAWEAIAKGIGFQPSSVKRVQEATSTQQNLIGQNKIREAEIADKWAAGRIENNFRKIAEARKELADWNKDNPESPIKIDGTQITKRVKEASKPKAERIAATAPKEIRGNVKKELETLNP